MKAKFGYLINGHFHLIYKGSLYDVDQYTLSHYKNRKDLSQKENLPLDAKVVLFCMDEDERVIYNKAGYALQSTILYDNGKIKDVEEMFLSIKENKDVFRHITKDLNERFSNLSSVAFSYISTFPNTIDHLISLIDENKKEKGKYNDLLKDKYYYYIKQAGIVYNKEEKSLHYSTEEIMTNTLNIEIKPGRLQVHGENIAEYLRNCDENKDYEEFWNMASLDDLTITVTKEKQYRKDPKK